MSHDELKNAREALEASLHVDDALQAAARQLVEPSSHIQQTLESVLGHGRFIPAPLVDGMLAQQLAELAAMVSVADERRSAIMEMNYTWQHEAERMAQSIADFEKQFRLPERYELSRLTQKLAEANVESVIGAHQKQIGDFHRAIGALRTPWLDRRDELRSLTGLAELQSIAQGLTRLSPFGAELTAKLRKDLGDWRTVAKLPESITEDAVKRLDFYHSLGFQRALTDFPAAAFDQSLSITGLRLPTLPPILPEYDREWEVESDDAEEENFARNGRGYDLLLRFETHIRQFIDVSMEEAFGPRWIKQRVPGPVYQGWKDRQQTARDNGEPERALIAYADFTDYIRIIERDDNWREVFRPIFVRKEDIKESFQRLHPIRLCTMHARFITSDDILLLEVETRRIFGAIGVIN